MKDTHPKAMARYLELLRAAPPEARLRTAIALSTAVRELTLAGLRERHPGADEKELRARLAVRLYGRRTAARAIADLPDDAV